MNVFQTLNYLQLKEVNEALVEARDLDSKFPVVADVYAKDKRVFEDNGFARLLCGILYEAAGAGDDLSEAFISYKQALTVYDTFYGGSYVPVVLQNALVRMARRFFDPALGVYRSRFPEARVDADRPGMATVYLLESTGFSPVKVSQMIPVPVGDGLVTKIAFPQFVRRPCQVHSSRLVLKDLSGTLVNMNTELGADVEALAEKDLEARKAMVLVKSVARPALKYLVERNQKEVIEKQHGYLAGQLFGLFSDLYNFYTEQADIRSWQALPAQVRLGRVQVAPGTYHVSVEDLNAAGVVISGEDKGEVELKEGQTYFFVRRALR